MNNHHNYKTVFIPVDFILHPKKQHQLIQFLKAHTLLSIADLARLLHVSIEKLIAVSEQKDFFSEKEAEKLAKYFCIFCGS